MKSIAVIGLMCLIAAMNGCATAANISSGRKMTPYGGACLDVAIVAITVAEETGLGEGASVPHSPLASPFIASLAVVDFPLSIAADTLTLPITSVVSLIRWARDKSEESHAKEEKPASVSSTGSSINDSRPVEEFTPN